MSKKAFKTSEIAKICDHSRETVKRWLEKGELKGYRVGTSGHWRVLAKDLSLFLKQNNIPFPEASEVGIDLMALADAENVPTFCWEFFKTKMKEHVRSRTVCEDCLVSRVRAINCYALREEVGHKKIHCKYSCEECSYFHFQKKEILPDK
jgi:excisionase family DNA binding protein